MGPKLVAVSIPHFAFPFRFNEDSAAVLEQDTPEEVEQGVLVLVLTHRGERIEVPDFGIDDLTFQLELDLEAVADAAQEWDERAELFIEENPDLVQGMIRNVSIEVEES